MRNEEKYKLYQELSRMTLNEVFREYEKVTGPEGTVKNWDRLGIIQGHIADRLDLTPADILREVLWEEFSDILKRIDQLEEQFKNHRHNLEKTYSEKPVY
jgi:hypothetical protein